MAMFGFITMPMLMAGVELLGRSSDGSSQFVFLVSNRPSDGGVGADKSAVEGKRKMMDWADAKAIYLASEIIKDLGVVPASVSQICVDLIAAELRALRHEGVTEGIALCDSAVRKALENPL
jgi:hypothetical protein